MATVADLEAALALVDKDTDALAAAVNSILPLKIGMTQAQIDAANTLLTSVASRLEGTAASITQPVPPGPPPAPVTP